MKRKLVLIISLIQLFNVPCLFAMQQGESSDALLAQISQESGNKDGLPQYADIVKAIIANNKIDKIEIASENESHFYWHSYRPKRMGINPATKKRIELEAVNVPRFKAGKNLRSVVRSIKIGQATK